MTRKDFVALAEALKGSRLVSFNDPAIITALEYQRLACAAAVARVLGQDNPRFDRARFLSACGVQS